MKKPALRRSEETPRWSGQYTSITGVTVPSHDACDCNPAVVVPNECVETFTYGAFEVEHTTRRVPQLCPRCYEALLNDWSGSSVADWSVVLHCREHPEYLLSLMAGAEVNGRALGEYEALGLRGLIAWATSHDDVRNRLVDGAPDLRESERRQMVRAFAEALLTASAQGYTSTGHTILPPSTAGVPEWLAEEPHDLPEPQHA